MCAAHGSLALYELAPGLSLARGGPGRSGADTNRSPLVNRLQRTLLPVSAHPVDRALREGDVLANLSLRPRRARLVQPPAALSSDAA